LRLRCVSVRPRSDPWMTSAAYAVLARPCAACAATMTSAGVCRLLGNSGKHITLETSKSNGILKVCFSGAGNSRIQEVWDLRSLEFADVQSSGNLVR
jgi:hypothetical protein